VAESFSIGVYRRAVIYILQAKGFIFRDCRLIPGAFLFCESKLQDPAQKPICIPSLFCHSQAWWHSLIQLLLRRDGMPVSKVVSVPLNSALFFQLLWGHRLLEPL